MKQTNHKELLREDIRHLDVFTIDPDTAKDFDDALSVRRISSATDVHDRYELGVHIADVTHFLPFNSPTDIRAQDKATSVYLVGTCLPMLPAHLSEEACSLVPNADRNTFSVFFDIDTRGHIHGTRFAKTLIHSKKRFTYSEAQRVLDTDTGTLARELGVLEKITKAVRESRLKNGGFEFNNEEIEFTFDAHGTVTSMHKKTLTYTMQMVEECMLLANVAVAKVLEEGVKKKRIPTGIYRVHDGPQGEKLAFLRVMLDSLHITYRPQTKIKSHRAAAQELRRVLRAGKEKGVESLVQMTLLRAMGKAEYVPHNRGHFGLGFPTYTHFTSPIRRYADVMVHRLLYSLLTGAPIPAAEARAYARLCVHATEREVEAQEMERESIKQAQVAYMEKHVGKRCNGIITGVMPFGIFVRDNETLAEGLVHISSLPDHLTHHEKTRSLRGQSSHYRLGDAVSFRIVDVDTRKGRIDCELV